MSIQLHSEPRLFDFDDPTRKSINAMTGLGARQFPFAWRPRFFVSFTGDDGESVEIWADASAGLEPPLELARARVACRGRDTVANVELVLGRLTLSEPFVWRFRLFADSELLADIAVPVERQR